MGGREAECPFPVEGVDGLGTVHEEAAVELEARAGGVLVGVEERGGELAVGKRTGERPGFDVGVLDAAPLAVGAGQDVVGAEEAGDFGRSGGFGDLAGVAGLNDVAFAHHEQVMAERVAFIEVVGDEQDGRVDFGQQAVELLAEGSVEPAGGFVEEQ